MLLWGVQWERGPGQGRPGNRALSRAVLADAAGLPAAAGPAPLPEAAPAVPPGPPAHHPVPGPLPGLPGAQGLPPPPLGRAHRAGLRPGHDRPQAAPAPQGRGEQSHSVKGPAPPARGHITPTRWLRPSAGAPLRNDSTETRPPCSFSQPRVDLWEVPVNLVWFGDQWCQTYSPAPQSCDLGNFPDASVSLSAK